MQKQRRLEISHIKSPVPNFGGLRWYKIYRQSLSHDPRALTIKHSVNSLSLRYLLFDSSNPQTGELFPDCTPRQNFPAVGPCACGSLAPLADTLYLLPPTFASRKSGEQLNCKRDLSLILAEYLAFSALIFLLGDVLKSY